MKLLDFWMIMMMRRRRRRRRRMTRMMMRHQDKAVQSSPICGHRDTRV
jgi:hypothetical protein